MKLNEITEIKGDIKIIRDDDSVDMYVGNDPIFFARHNIFSDKFTVLNFFGNIETILSKYDQKTIKQAFEKYFDQIKSYIDGFEQKYSVKYVNLDLSELNIIIEDIRKYLNIDLLPMLKKKFKFYPNSSDMNKNINGIFNLLIRDCKPFLESIDYNLSKYKLFRGIRDNRNFFKKRSFISKGRLPMDTHSRQHDFLNNIFKKYHGWNARDGVFATGDAKTARLYGTVFVIFPIGNFRFVWSEENMELLFSPEMTEQDKLDFFNMKNYEEIIKKYERDYEELIKRYRTTDMKRAILSEHEIMIEVENYYCLKVNSPFYQPILDKFDEYRKTRNR